MISNVEIRESVLPQKSLVQLRFQESVEMIDQLIFLEQKLEGIKQELSSELFKVIASLPEGADRKELISLRRMCNKNKNIEISDELSKIISPNIANQLSALIEKRKETQQNYQNIKEKCEKEIHDEKILITKKLIEIAKSPELLFSLVSAAPTLLKRLQEDKIIGEKGANRRIASVASYVYRVAAKTSPYSLMMRSFRGEKNSLNLNNTDRDDLIALKNKIHRTKVLREIDGKILSIVLRDIQQKNLNESDVKFRVNPSLDYDKSKEKYLALGPLPEEHIMRMPDSWLSRLVWEKRKTTGNKADWLKWISETSTSSIIAEDVLKFIIDNNILYPIVKLSGFEFDPLNALEVSSKSLSNYLPYQKTLESLVKYTGDVGDWKNWSSQLEKHYIVEELVNNLLEEMGTNRKAVLGNDSRAYHDVSICLGNRNLGIKPKEEEELTRSLDLISEYLSVFEPNATFKLALAHGAKKLQLTKDHPSILVFYDRIMQAREKEDSYISNFLTYWTGPIPGRLDDATPDQLVTKEMKLLAEERKSIIKYFADQGIYDGKDVEISPKKIQDVLDQRPDYLIKQSPSTWYVQRVGSHNNSIEWVINAAHVGYGRGYMRNTLLYSNVNNRSAFSFDPTITSGKKKLPDVYTWNGFFGSTLNLKKLECEFLLLYPFSEENEEDKSMSYIRDIKVSLDDNSQKLILSSASSSTKANEIYLEHLGMMANFQLPPFAQFCDRAFSKAILLHPSNPYLANQFKINDLPDIFKIGRITCGNIVIQRRRTIIREHMIPKREQYTSDLDFWMSIRRVFTKIGIPYVSFVRAWGRGGEKGSKDGKARKPQLLDLDSLLSIDILSRSRKDVDYLVFDEALPDPISVDEDEGYAVTEVRFETPGHQF